MRNSATQKCCARFIAGSRDQRERGGHYPRCGFRAPSHDPCRRSRVEADVEVSIHHTGQIPAMGRARGGCARGRGRCADARLQAEAQGARWLSRSSKPLPRADAASGGGFDSHALPPLLVHRFACCAARADDRAPAGPGARSASLRPDSRERVVLARIASPVNRRSGPDWRATGRPATRHPWP